MAVHLTHFHEYSWVLSSEGHSILATQEKFPAGFLTPVISFNLKMHIIYLTYVGVYMCPMCVQ